MKIVWPVFKGDKPIGTVRSATWSPRLEKNIALAMLSIEYTDTGTVLSVQTPEITVEAKVTPIPFIN